MRSPGSTSLHLRPVAVSLMVAGLCWLIPAAAAAKAHLWRFEEFFSNADGSVQFIEMRECCGSSEETRLRTWDVRSTQNTYLFPGNLTGDTANRYLLLATQSFADLPGAPAPDFIIPPQFFDPQGDTLTYRQADAVTIPAGAMPVDGVASVGRDMTVHVNDPTNFAGVTGSVVAAPSVPSLLPAAVAGLLAALAGLGAWRSNPSRPRR